MAYDTSRLVSEVLSPPNCPSLLSPPPQTVHISWLLPWMSGAALASVLYVVGRPRPSHCCCPIIVVQLPLSYRHHENTAVVVIDMVAIGSGGGIITTTIVIAVAITVCTIAVFLSSLLTLPQQRCLFIVVVVVLFCGHMEELDQTTPPQTVHIALASILQVGAGHCHHIVVIPSLLSNCRCPIAVLKLPLSLSMTLLPSAAAVASLPCHCHRHCCWGLCYYHFCHHCGRCFVDVALSL